MKRSESNGSLGDEGTVSRRKEGKARGREQLIGIRLRFIGDVSEELREQCARQVESWGCKRVGNSFNFEADESTLRETLNKR
jgi:hypothetical protein